MGRRGTVLIIACGALAREIVAFVHAHAWQHVDIACLPAQLHNTPASIPALLRAKIRARRADYGEILVAYGDCGTAGKIDRVCADEGVTRVRGAHCYAFYAGTAAFAELAAREPACFFLTDFLARNFDRLVWRGLGLDRHPQLRADYFGNYTRLVYLAQTDADDVLAEARAAAARLGLEFEHRRTGLGDLDRYLGASITRAAAGRGISAYG